MSQQVADEPDLQVLDPELAQALAWSHRTLVTSLAGSGLLVILLVAVGIIAVPYIKLSPGPMYNTIGSVNGIELISINGTQTYPVSGELDLVTVNERGGPFGGLTYPEAFYGWLNPDNTVVPVDALYPPGTTAKEALEENAAQFTSSQSKATAAALNELKIPVTTKVVVAVVIPGSPATGKIEPGDVITAVDGKPVNSPDELPPLIRSRAPGTVVQISLTSKGAALVVPITLAANPADPALGFAGVQTGAQYSGPFLITFGLEDVGGPSAGMMFSLGIIDKLTPGELNAGRQIGGTGTISPEGKVGPIGGMQQKLVAGRDHGSQLFLVPAANCGDVLEHPQPTLNVAKVSTLTEAMDVITKWKSGSPDLPRC